MTSTTPIREDSEVRALAAALMAEITALVRFSKMRGYLQLYEDYRAALKTGCDYDLPKIPINENYMKVYEANVGSIWKLPPHIAFSIAEFYMYTTSIIERLNLISDGVLVYPEQKTKYVEVLIGLLDDAQNKTGPSIISQLAALAKTEEPDC